MSKRKNKGYRVCIEYTVTYDPASEVPGIEAFYHYEEGREELVRKETFWDDFRNSTALGIEWTEEDAVTAAERKMTEYLFSGRYQSGNVEIRSLSCTPLCR